MAIARALLKAPPFFGPGPPRIPDRELVVGILMAEQIGHALVSGDTEKEARWRVAQMGFVALLRSQLGLRRLLLRQDVYITERLINHVPESWGMDKAGLKKDLGAYRETLLSLEEQMRQCGQTYPPKGNPRRRGRRVSDQTGRIAAAFELFVRCRMKHPDAHVAALLKVPPRTVRKKVQQFRNAQRRTRGGDFMRSWLLYQLETLAWFFGRELATRLLNKLKRGKLTQSDKQVLVNLFVELARRGQLASS